MQDGQDNTYFLRATHGAYLAGCVRGPITLTSAEPSYNLPNPNFLKLHAYCCRVANLSGAAEYIDSQLDELFNTDVLCQDGSSADVLKFALQEIIVG